MTSKRRSLINLLSLSYLSKSISKSLYKLCEYKRCFAISNVTNVQFKK